MVNTPVSAKLMSRRSRARSASNRSVTSSSSSSTAAINKNNNTTKRSTRRKRGGETTETDVEAEEESAEDDSQLFVVEEVRDARQARAGTQYLVKWQGYEECTWEPKSHLSAALIAEFESSRSSNRRSGVKEEDEEKNEKEEDVEKDEDKGEEAEAEESGSGEQQQRTRLNQSKQRVNRKLPVPHNRDEEEAEVQEEEKKEEDNNGVADEEKADADDVDMEQEEADEVEEQSRTRTSEAAAGRMGPVKRTTAGRKRRRAAQPTKQNKRKKSEPKKKNRRRAATSKEEEEEEEGAEVEWEVERIVNSRIDRKGVVEYRLKWKRVGDSEVASAVDEEQATDDEEDDESYSWVKAVDCHCDELIQQFEQRYPQQQSQSQQQQQPVANGGVLIELMEPAEDDSYPTTVIIQDITNITAHIVIDATGDDTLDSSSTFGLVDESAAASVFNVSEGNESTGNSEEDAEASVGTDADVQQQDEKEKDGEEATDSSSEHLKPSAASLSSASSFVRRSVSPLVERVSAAFCALHKPTQPASSSDGVNDTTSK